MSDPRELMGCEDLRDVGRLETDGSVVRGPPRVSSGARQVALALFEAQRMAPRLIGERAVLTLAAEADSDPRTARAYLSGRHVRGRVRERLNAAARSLGLL